MNQLERDNKIQVLKQKALMEKGRRVSLEFDLAGCTTQELKGMERHLEAGSMEEAEAIWFMFASRYRETDGNTAKCRELGEAREKAGGAE